MGGLTISAPSASPRITGKSSKCSTRTSDGVTECTTRCHRVYDTVSQSVRHGVTECTTRCHRVYDTVSNSTSYGLDRVQRRCSAVCGGFGSLYQRWSERDGSRGALGLLFTINVHFAYFVSSALGIGALVQWTKGTIQWMRIDPRTFGFRLSRNVVVPVVVVFLFFKVSQISLRGGFVSGDIVERALSQIVLIILSNVAVSVTVFGCNFAIGTTIWTMIIIYASNVSSDWSESRELPPMAVVTD